MGNLDPNVYATKKTIAQGLLDVALLTANASQLKYLLQVGKEHEFYHVMMVLISFSIILQIAIGVVAILKSRRNINEEAQQESANFFNNVQVWLAFAATVIHVFLSVFTITPQVQPPMTDDVFDTSTTEADPNANGT